MNTTAVPQTHVYTRLSSIAVFLTGLAAFALTAVAPADAAPVRKDGKIYACYKVKGKPRGSMRLLFKGKRCRRGERRVAWMAAPPIAPGGESGAPVAPGASQPTQPPAQGQPTQPPAQSPAEGADVSALEAQIAGLTVHVESLEDILAGIGNADLLAALDALALVEQVCDQATALTTQVGLLQDVIGGLGLNGVLQALGGLLLIPSQPEALDPFACSAA